MEYKIDTNDVIDYGENVFSDSIWGDGQIYAQLDNLLYVIVGNDDSLASFDMSTNEYTSSITSIPYYESTASDNSCLATINSYLIIIGGRTNSLSSLNTVFTFNLQSMQWDNFIPSMNTKRDRPSCVVVDNTLYTIAGFEMDLSTYQLFRHRSIEKINVNNPSRWTLTDSLSRDVSISRAVVHNGFIYVIGSDVDIVHIIDTQNGDQVSLLNDPLPFILGYTSCTATSRSIWCAGGGDGEEISLDTIVKYALLCFSHSFSFCIEYCLLYSDHLLLQHLRQKVCTFV